MSGCIVLISGEVLSDLSPKLYQVIEYLRSLTYGASVLSRYLVFTHYPALIKIASVDLYCYLVCFN
jgi:hypothetical protein